MKLSSIKNNKVLKIIGTLLMVASIAYVAITIWKSREALILAINNKSLIVAVTLSIFVCGALVLFALLYRMMINALSGHDPGGYCTELYIHSTLYKYLPGNVMHFVGRNALVKEGEISFAHINFATFLELLATLISSFLVAVFFSGRLLICFLIDHIDYRWLIAAFALGIIALAVLFVIFRHKLITFFRQLMNKRVILTFALMVLIYGLWNVLGNSMLFFLLKSFGCELQKSAYGSIIGAATGAWFIGFITPGAPGGIGVREAAMNFLLAGAAPTWAISAGGVVTRVAQIVGELLANAVLAIVCIGKKKRGSEVGIV